MLKPYKLYIGASILVFKCQSVTEARISDLITKHVLGGNAPKPPNLFGTVNSQSYQHMVIIVHTLNLCTR
jgi:hypothetical protein